MGVVTTKKNNESQALQLVGRKGQPDDAAGKREGVLQEVELEAGRAVFDGYDGGEFFRSRQSACG